MNANHSAILLAFGEQDASEWVRAAGRRTVPNGLAAVVRCLVGSSRIEN
jgi:hypothetical protein